MKQYWDLFIHWQGWSAMATGCVVCLLVSATGVYMIRRANREIKKITGE